MLIDSNILVYAINADSPKNRLAQSFLERYNATLEITHQNIFEALRVLTHPKFSHPMRPKEAQESILAIANSCKVIYPNNKTHYLALEFIKEHNLVGNRIFDAYLVATIISNNLSTIATDNVKDFIKYKIEILNPFSK